MQRIRLQAYNGQYVCAEGGGGQILIANRSQASTWETFEVTNLSDLTGGPLISGHRIGLRAHNGQYVHAENSGYDPNVFTGGGGLVYATSQWIRQAETFVIEKVGGSGEIKTGDSISLKPYIDRAVDHASAVSGTQVQSIDQTQTPLITNPGGVHVVSALTASTTTQTTPTTRAVQLQRSPNYFQVDGNTDGRILAIGPWQREWETFRAELIGIPRSARYRVVINGFQCNAETWDDALERDGKRDELQLRTKVVKLDRSGQAVTESQLTSITMGDTWRLPGRAQAGSASNRGGFRTGDTFPTNTPWMQSSAPSITRNYPPLKVWEGELAQGEDALVVVPTLWEWDPGEDAVMSWIKWGSGVADEFGKRIGDLLGTTGTFIFNVIDLGLDIAVSMEKAGLTGYAGSRPIGMQKGQVLDKFEFKPLALVFNYTNVEKLLNDQDEPAGRGPGVFALEFIDDPYYRGHYTMYVQIERV